MTTTMLALYQDEHGDLSKFKLGQVAKPSAALGEVLLRVHAASINPIDIKRNHMNLQDTFPIVVGFDVAGVVDSVGEGVTQFRAGDRVFGDVMANSIGVKTTGTVAEFCACRADLLTAMPAALSFVDAASMPLVAQTAIAGLQAAGAKTGDRLFVTAGAGGVGVFLMQIAKALFGVAEIATTASAAKGDFVKMYGADHVVDYKTQDAGELFKGWADVVFDMTGETEMERRIVKQGGSIVSIVNVSEPDVINFLVEPTGEMMQKVATLWSDGKLVPVLDSMYSMEDAVKAVEHVGAGRSKGKVVVKVVT